MHDGKSAVIYKGVQRLMKERKNVPTVGRVHSSIN